MKQKRTVPKKSAPTPKKPDLKPSNDDQGENAYGGIPQRDLKKNLGCG